MDSPTPSRGAAATAGAAGLKKPKKRRRTSSAGTNRKKAVGKKPKRKSMKSKGRRGKSMPHTSSDEEEEEDIAMEVEFKDITKEQWEKLSEEEKDHYQDYKRSHLSKNHVKRTIASVAGSNKKIDEESLIAVSSCAKMFVGEIVETARRLMDKDGISPAAAVPPKYIRKAYGFLRKHSKHINVSVKYLGMHHNEIGEKGCEALSKALKMNETLEEISIYSNRKGPFWGTLFGRSLLSNPQSKLRVLDIGGNGLKDEGCVAIANALATNRVLTELHVDFCDIGPKGIRALAKAMSVNRTLTRLWIHGNPRIEGSEDLNTLRVCVDRNVRLARKRRADSVGLFLSAEDTHVVGTSESFLCERFRALCDAPALAWESNSVVASASTTTVTYSVDGTHAAASGAVLVGESTRKRKKKKKGQMDEDTLSLRLARAAIRCYQRTCPKHAEAWRRGSVLSAILAENVRTGHVAVLSFGIGTKLLSPAIAMEDREAGEILRDSHAEVLARRGFLKFAYGQVAALLKAFNRSSLSDENDARETSGVSSGSIFAVANVSSGEDTAAAPTSVSQPLPIFVLRPDIRLHLYTSTAPCGGASIASSKFEGLRTCLLVKGGIGGCGLSESNPRRFPGGCVRPVKIDSVVGSSASRLTCTDKIVRWNAVGLQGALLSILIPRPMYLSSIAIGRKFARDRLDASIGRPLRRYANLATARGLSKAHGGREPVFGAVPSSASFERLCGKDGRSAKVSTGGGDGDECIVWSAAGDLALGERHDGRVGRPLRNSGTRFRCARASSLELLLDLHAIRWWWWKYQKAALPALPVDAVSSHARAPRGKMIPVASRKTLKETETTERYRRSRCVYVESIRLDAGAGKGE
eukprot:g4886.t1